MITTTNDRHKFIGGSEANMIYLNYKSKTFVKWWSEKLAGVPSEPYNNLSMSVGTILEHDVVDLYESVHGVKGIRDKQEIKGIARANTDYIISGKVSDVKVTTKAFEWYLKDKVPLNYKRQLIHYLHVFDYDQASIIAYQVDDGVMENPFGELSQGRLYEIEVPISAKEIEEHKKKLEYLSFCKEMNIFPEEG